MTTKLGSELTIGESFSYLGNPRTVWTIESFSPKRPFLGAIPGRSVFVTGSRGGAAILTVQDADTVLIR